MNGTLPQVLLNSGPVGAAVAPYWPEIGPTTLENWANDHQNAATQLNDAVTRSGAIDWNEVLQSPRTGPRLHQSLANNVNTWRHDAIEHQDASAALNDAATIVGGLQTDLEEIVSHNYSQYEKAKSLSQAAAARGNAHEAQAYAREAQGYVSTAQSEAQLAADSAKKSILTALNGKFGTAPPGFSQQVPGQPNQSGVVLTSYQRGGNANGRGRNGSGTGGPGSPSGTGWSSPGAAQVNYNTANPFATVGDGVYGQQYPGQIGMPPVTQPPVVTPMPTPVSSVASPAVSSAPVSSGASAPASSGALGSSLASGSGQGLAAASTAPAESSAVAPAVASSGAATASGAGGSGSGVASGIGAAGALPSAVRPIQMPSATAQPAATTLTSVPPITDVAPTSTAPGLSSPPPMDAGSAGGGAVAGGPGGGAMAPAPGPLAPYSPPGSGFSSPAPPASAPATPLGSPLAGPAAGGVAPLITGSGAAGRPAGAATKRVNPDLVSAQRVLAGLVKACPARPIFWAVSVLRSPVGPQTLIAGSVGGGGYLPPEVSVPSTVQLAVLDPALPFGWAAEWMGWQSPLAILVDHYERVAKVVAGETVSAMTTSELWPSRPDCGGDFSAVRHEELVTSSAAPLTGGHRLTATDPALAARLTVLDQGGDITNFVAAQLTRAIWMAAAQPDETGMPIAVKEDADILELVSAGAARSEHWDDYRREVERRGDGAVMMPEIHAPRDADDSPGSIAARMWYRHYYARGRIAEMVTCWASPRVSILDIAYCGVAVGFGAVVAAVVTELEARFGISPGPAGGVR